MEKKWESAAAFIRSMPNDVPAADVVEAGKAQGVKFTANAVYTTRSDDRHRNGKANRAKLKRVKLKRVFPVKPKSSSASADKNRETVFRSLVFLFGVEKSKAIIEDMESEIAKLLTRKLEYKVT